MRIIALFLKKSWTTSKFINKISESMTLQYFQFSLEFYVGQGIHERPK